MRYPLLSRIDSPSDLRDFPPAHLSRLAAEIRSVLCDLVSDRSAHFASNLGVVELSIALHTEFDFTTDRLIWDTGHQVYPHKLLTGRFKQFFTLRRQGGLMGYPNPMESAYDLFMTGHAGASLSTVLGLKVADDLIGDEVRKAVAVIGDGAFPSGIVFEAINNAVALKKDLLVILNDNRMGICPRVGGLAEYLDRFRSTQGSPFSQIPATADLGPSSPDGDSALIARSGSSLFEGLGLQYFGPIDGHDLPGLQRVLRAMKCQSGPVLLHVFTEKGHGFAPARQDPVAFHTPPAFQQDKEDAIVSIRRSSTRTYSNSMSESIERAMRRSEKVAVLTAAMCQGNKLEAVRDEFPDRFFDTGICEGHAVAFAAGMAKSGMRPIVNIYSTFLQRSFDQIFQEVALQNLPVTFCLDRAGLAGPDGPTHHGVFDNTYMRTFPNITVMAPGDEQDVQAMLDFALDHDGPVSIRYPKASADSVARRWTPIEHGRAEVYRWGEAGMFIAFGTLFGNCVEASARLKAEGIDMGVINARFARPLDVELILQAIEASGCVITVEENSVVGGFGSAVLEAVNAAGLTTNRLHRLGIPDAFVPHGERDDLLAEFDLDVEGLASAARSLVSVPGAGFVESVPWATSLHEGLVGAV